MSVGQHKRACGEWDRPENMSNDNKEPATLGVPKELEKLNKTYGVSIAWHNNESDSKDQYPSLKRGIPHDQAKNKTNGQGKECRNSSDNA